MAYRPLPETAEPAYRAGALALLGAVTVILVALVFEHIGGYAPCPLCLQQRYAYYAGIPAIFGGLILLAARRPKAAAFLLFAAALGFLANAGLGGYHAGVEWKFWPGPDTCTRDLEPLKPLTGGLLKQLDQVRVIRCDAAAWRFLGLSFAGWNAVTSLLIACAAVQAAAVAWHR